MIMFDRNTQRRGQVKAYPPSFLSRAIDGDRVLQQLHAGITERGEAHLHCPVFLLAVLLLPMSKFVLPWHSRFPRMVLPTTSTGPVLSRTTILPPTELSNISAELVLSTTSKLPPIELPAQNTGAVDPS